MPHRAPHIRKFSLAWLIKFQIFFNTDYNDGLAQDSSISIANAMEIMKSCTKPSIYDLEENFTQTHFPDWLYLTELDHSITESDFL